MLSVPLLTRTHPWWRENGKQMTSYAINTHLATMTLLKACVPWQWARMLRPPVGGRRSRSRSRAHDPFFFWSCHALAGANAVFYAVAILVFNVGCSWSRGAVGRGGEGGCAVDARAFALASAALAFVLDVLALLLPQGFIVRATSSFLPCLPTQHMILW